MYRLGSHVVTLNSVRESIEIKSLRGNVVYEQAIRQDCPALYDVVDGSLRYLQSEAEIGYWSQTMTERVATKERESLIRWFNDFIDNIQIRTVTDYHSELKDGYFLQTPVGAHEEIILNGEYSKRLSQCEEEQRHWLRVLAPAARHRAHLNADQVSQMAPISWEKATKLDEQDSWEAPTLLDHERERILRFLISHQGKDDELIKMVKLNYEWPQVKATCVFGGGWKFDPECTVEELLDSLTPKRVAE